MKVFTYSDGTPVFKNDIICFYADKGFVEDVIQPNTKNAKDYSCESDGGVLLNMYSTGGLFLVSASVLDEDIQFISRNP